MRSTTLLWIMLAAGGCAPDADGDGVADEDDECPADPGKDEAGDCGCGVPEDDSDRDGLRDCFDVCPDDPQKTVDDGVCGCDIDDVDSDNDNLEDCLDVCPNDPNKTVDDGICGCDIDDVDTDGDDVEDCLDLCPQDSAKTDDAGQCGCGMPETDSDGDSVPDCVDICEDAPDVDSDGDGVLDCNDICPDAPDIDTDGDTVVDCIDQCEGEDDLDDADGDTVPTCLDACPTYDPSPLVTASGCDEPGIAFIGGTFTVAGATATGRWTFDLRDVDTNSPICTQSFDFSADFVMPDEVVGCDKNGANCVSVCPADDPTDGLNVWGSCVGHFANFSPDPTSYQTDCTFAGPAPYFHPNADLTPFFDGILSSYPIEYDIPVSSAFGTWGDVAEFYTSAGEYAGFYPGLQISIASRHNNSLDESWTNSPVLLGFTLLDPALNPGGVNANGEGTHEFIGFRAVFF